MPNVWLSLAVIAASILLARADEYIYSDASLSGTWQDWSWSSTISYAATNVPTTGTSISITSTAYAAFSLKDTATFGSYAGLKFDIAGDNPEVQIYFESSTESLSTTPIALSSLSKTVTSTAFSSFTLDFSALPPNGAPLGTGNWDRLSFQALGNGATYNLDNLLLVDSIIVKPVFLSAEPLANNIIAVTSQGAVDYSSVKVTLNGKAIAVKSNTTVSSVDIPNKKITYFTLASDLAAGTLAISATNATFSYTLPAAQTGTVSQGSTHPISANIYGVNFPTSASYIQNLGIPMSRRGGNAESGYNPFGDFTNAGSDWYFENRGTENADSWVGWVKGAGSSTTLLLPSLDWVAKDSSSYSYPKSLYPNSAAFDPYKADAGNGQYANGTYVSPDTDPKLAYTPWNTTLATKYLTGLKNKPTVLTIDNEIEIASSTHHDIHPAPLGYDEIFSRVISFGTAAKAAIPSVQIAAPSTCAWWFYWTSAVGQSDKTAHNGTDFLPWFVQQLKKHDTSTGKRLLDYLDIHYYFAPDTSANDAAAKAKRLRMSRSLWDASYVDESWIGTDTAWNNQTNPHQVNLIPRFQNMIGQYYPGTKLSIGEWSSGDTDLTGGLLTVDVLGIFGKYKLDSATYWVTPDEKGPVGTAYWLYRGYGKYFGNQSALVSITGYNPDLLGVYAGTDSTRHNLSLVIVNKDPSKAIALSLAGVPVGSYFLRHFGGLAGVAKYQTNITIDTYKYIVVPAYTAVFLQQNL